MWMDRSFLGQSPAASRGFAFSGRKSQLSRAFWPGYARVAGKRVWSASPGLNGEAITTETSVVKRKNNNSNTQKKTRRWRRRRRRCRVKGEEEEVVEEEV